MEHFSDVPATSAGAHRKVITSGIAASGIASRLYEVAIARSWAGLGCASGSASCARSVSGAGTGLVPIETSALDSPSSWLAGSKTLPMAKTSGGALAPLASISSSSRLVSNQVGKNFDAWEDSGVDNTYFA